MSNRIFATNESIAELIKVIEAKKDTINNYRSVNKIALLKVKESLHVKDICNSLRIEGIVFTERETRVVLENLAITEKTTKSVIETLNLNTAIRYMEKNLDRKLDLNLIKELHYMCMTNVLEYGSCGEFRDGGVIITQSEHIPPHSSKVKSLLEKAINEYYNCKEPKLYCIFKFKHAFTNTHPFFDGNGRVSRLISNLLLLQNKYVPVIINADDKLEYYESLEYADLYLDYRWFVHFMLKQLDNTYNLYLSMFNRLEL